LNKELHQVDTIATGDVTVTIAKVSGEVKYGPTMVARTTTIAELKDRFDKDINKELLFNDRFLEDADTLQGLLPPAEVKLVVGLVSDPQLRAFAAATALEEVSPTDMKSLCTVTKESGILLLRLLYTGCLLALAAVHGEDSESSFWKNFQGFPLDSSTEDLEVRVSGQDSPSGYVKARKMRTDKHWPKGDMLPAENLIDGLKHIDHEALKISLQDNTGRQEELRHLLASPNLTYRHLSRLQDSTAFYVDDSDGNDERWQSVQRCMVSMMNWLVHRWHHLLEILVQVKDPSLFEQLWGLVVEGSLVEIRRCCEPPSNSGT